MKWIRGLAIALIAAAMLLAASAASASGLMRLAGKGVVVGWPPSVLRDRDIQFRQGTVLAP